jgi:RNA polymerase sigma-70 factor (ECF subfamily)
MSSSTLSAFHAALPSATTITEDLEPALAALLGRAQARWPGFGAADEGFVAHVAERWGEDPLTAASLAAVHAEDLYLAYACALGVGAALATFESAHGSTIQQAVRRIDAPPGWREDAVQLVRHRLLVAAPGERPRIAQYSGRAELAAFVRVVAVRVALSALRREPRDLVGDDALAGVGDGSDGPELQYLKRVYKDQFRAAFAAAIEGLSARDRSMLRYQIVDGLGLEQIAAIHGRPRSTSGRYVLEARARLVDETRAQLRRQLRIDGNELSSVLRLVDGSVDVSVRRLLTAGPSAVDAGEAVDDR